MQLVTTVIDDTTQALMSIWDAVGTEIAMMVLFCAGFALFRVGAIQRLLFGNAFRPISGKVPGLYFGAWLQRHAADSMLPAKELEANWASGRADLVLQAWPNLQNFSLATVRAVLEALIFSGRASEVPVELRRAMCMASAVSFRNTPEATTLILDAVADAPDEVVAEVRGILERIQRKAPKRAPMATASNHSTSRSGSSEVPSPAAHSHALRIRSALQNKQLNAAVESLLAMRSAGHAAPAACVAALMRLASEQGRVAQVFEELPRDLLSPEATASVLESAAKLGNITLVREVHQLAIAGEVVLLQAGREALVRGYSSAGDSRAVEVFDEMSQDGFAISDTSLASLVSLCAESRHVQMAEHVVEYSQQMYGQVSLALYSALMKVYTHARLFSKACDLYEVMKKSGITLDTVAYGSLIKAAVESGRLELAHHLFKESGNPDLLNYMSLIRAAGRERNVQKALDLLGELERSPVSMVDVTAYNCVLEVCVACGDRAAAEGLLRQMEESGHVDVISYNTYLKILLSGGSHVEIENVLQGMRQRMLQPNAVTYNSLIKDLIARQDLQGAWKLIEEMEQDGVSPDAFTCSILVKGVKHVAGPDDVDKIIALIERAKVTPDEVLVNCLLDACVRLRNVQRLTQVLEQFKATGVVPSLHACATLIRAYGHARRLDRAQVIWRELTEERMLIPNEEVFACMVDASLANGDLDGAVAVFRQAKSALADFPRAPTLFSALAKACVTRKQLNLAMEVYDEIKDLPVCNKVTYNTLIDALVRQGDMDAASGMFRDMTLNGVMPDLITYSTLVKGHSSRGDLEQGLQLIGQMQRCGITPDAIVFNSILDGCAHKQMRSLTEMVLKDMEAAGIAPSNFTLSILVKLYGRLNDLETAFYIVDLYPKKYGFELNAQVYTCLMSACIANGELEDAIEVYERMTAAGCPSDSKTYQTLLAGCLRHSDLDCASRLLDDALRHTPPIGLDHDTIENVLFMTARRGRSADLGMPLLERLAEVGIQVSDRVTTAIMHPNDSIRESRPHQRRPRTNAGHVVS